MSIRVNHEEVKCLIPSTSIEDLTPFITAASLLTDRLEASDCGSELTDEELFEVEKWLSAHYASVSDSSLAVISEEFEGAKNVYSRGSTKNAQGIMSTQYGQMANTLSGGCLVELDKRKISLAAVGGEHYSE